MKRLILLFLIIFANILNAQISLNLTGDPPDASAAWDIQFSNKGILIPRVSLSSTTDGTTIPNPATSLLVYNTNASMSGGQGVGYYYNAGTPGSPNWVKFLVGKEAWLITGNDNITAPTSGYGTTINNNFIGTTNNIDFAIATNNYERFRIKSTDNQNLQIAIGSTSVVNYTGGNPSILQIHDWGTTTNDYSQLNISMSSTNIGRVGVINFAATQATNERRTAAIESNLTAYSGGNATGDLRFFTNNNNVYQERMRLSPQGYLGINTTSPSHHLHVAGNSRIENYLLVGNPTSTSTTRRGYKTFYLTSPINVQNGYLNSPSLGTLDIPSGTTSITVTKVVYAINGYHEDGDEKHSTMVRIGTTDFGIITETANSGFTAVDWTNTSSHNTSFTSSQNVYFRIQDESDLFDERFYIINAFITIFFEYSIAIQNGDIIAEGNVYSRTIYSTGLYGDLAEHFNVIASENQIIEAGKIVSIIPGSEAIFTLANLENINHMAGVISENPTVLLNNPSEGIPVAMVGRVKVKLVPSNELVQSGDFITVSSIPGLGEKALTSGPIIGYAITNQKKGEDFVEIILQPGRYVFIDKTINKNNTKPGRFNE